MGADVNATDNANLTALFWAVYHARPEIIKILLRYDYNYLISKKEKLF